MCENTQRCSHHFNESYIFNNIWHCRSWKKSQFDQGILNLLSNIFNFFDIISNTFCQFQGFIPTQSVLHSKHSLSLKWDLAATTYFIFWALLQELSVLLMKVLCTCFSAGVHIYSVSFAKNSCLKRWVYSVARGAACCSMP